MRKVLLLSLLSMPAFAVVPTINCTENERGVIFEEGIDDFLVDVRDVSMETGLIGPILGKNDRQQYLLQVRIPKRNGTEFSAGRPSCMFSEENPLLIGCPGIRPTEKAKLTNKATGDVTEITVNYVTFTSSTIKKESVDFQGKIQSESQVKFAMQMSFVPLPVDPPPTDPSAPPGSPLPVTPRPVSPFVPGRPISRPGFVNGEMDMRQVSCKTGEQAESPAR